MSETVRPRVVVIFHLPGLGGPAKSLLRPLEAIAPHVDLEAVFPDAGPGAEAYARIARTRILPYAAATFPRNIAAVLGSVRRTSAEAHALRDYLRAADPALVVVVTTAIPAALLAARRQRTKTLVYVGELFDKGALHSRGRTVAGFLLRRLVESAADEIVACSDAVARQFEGAGGKPIVTTVSPGVDGEWEEGDRAAFRGRWRLDAAAPCVVVVGDVTRGRGQDLAIGALSGIRRHFPRAHCLIAGAPHGRPEDTAYHAELLELAESLSLRDAVTFTGFVERIQDVYAAADIVLNPARFAEPFGRVAVEAMASGRPVISARVGAVPEVIDDGANGILVPPEDPDAIAAAVVRLWKDEELRDRLVVAGRERVRTDFTEESRTKLLESIFARLLDGDWARSRANGSRT